VTIAPLEEDSSFDVGKVASLKAAISCGSYRIDYEALASAIMDLGRTADSQKFDVAAPSGN
jgi:anti-sigma28 factor (negative regulator of flagellin synthesis)